MRILSAFLLLAVLGGLAAFLTFSSSWGTLLMPQTRAESTELAAAAGEPASPTPDWAGKLTADVPQPVVLRAAPALSAPLVGMLQRGDKVALTVCDAEVLWCQTEDEAWLLAYMVDGLPLDLPILDKPGLTVKDAKLAPTPTEEPSTPPTATAAPTLPPLALLLPTPTPAPVTIEATVKEKANLRKGPGTEYAVAGSAVLGEQILLAGQTADGAWYKLANGAWIAAFLIEAPASQPPVVDSEAAEQAENSALTEVLSGPATAEARAQPSGDTPVAAPENAVPENAVPENAVPENAGTENAAANETDSQPEAIQPSS
ncbi:MAG: hypothetical protein IAE81_01475 [Caldilineaceae bacterium]|jgi:uncharacterized protein YraI|nr:hypothetical protein [Caldilineaceae bacterium]